MGYSPWRLKILTWQWCIHHHQETIVQGIAMDWRMFPQKVCSSPNPGYLWMWSYLEIGFLWEWALISCKWYLCKKRHGENSVTLETRIRETHILIQTNKPKGLPATTRSYKRGLEPVLFQSAQSNQPYWHFDFRPLGYKLWGHHLLF